MPKEEVAVFDQEALKKRVTETIQTQFGMMIPEKEWTALVEKEVKAFFEAEGADLLIGEEREDIRKTGYYAERVKTTVRCACSPFRAIVWDYLREITRTKVETLLQGEKLKSVISSTWEGEYEHVEAELGTMLEKTLEGLIPEMLKQMFRGIVGQGAEMIKEQIRIHLANQSNQF